VQSINVFVADDHGRLDTLLEGFQEWKAKAGRPSRPLVFLFLY
jgi:hypothetical protein